MNRKPKEYINEYLEYYKKVEGIDIEFARDLIKQLTSYYKGDNYVRHNTDLLLRLERQWYNSLEMNNPDYSVYKDKYYFTDTLVCWLVYSRRYLKNITMTTALDGRSIIDDLGAINSVVDLGCGCGYSTARLKSFFPDADVYGTNVKDSIHYEVLKEVAKKYNFNLITDVEQFIFKDDVDLIVAFEYFEHWQHPAEHLEYILSCCTPKHFLFANAFNTKSVGHFDIYKDLEATYSGKEMTRFFNTTLKNYGYHKVKAKIFNNRPTYWKRNDVA